MNAIMNATQTQALLEAARIKLGGVTDYQMAKTLEIHRQILSRLHAGTQHADAYTCTRLAMILERDPLELIALVEADSAKTEARRTFWQTLPSSLKRTALAVGAFCMTLGSLGGGPPAGGGAGSTSHNEGFRKRAMLDRRGWRH